MLSPRLAPIGAALALALLSACTVRPLYADAGLETGSLAGAPSLRSVSVSPETTRVGLEVRNQLIFLLNGGAGDPAGAPYIIELNVDSKRTTGAIVQATKDSEPTAGNVTVSSSYKLREASTGTVVGIGRRSVTSSYDIPRQEFAALRAERDAQDRAARELAELMRHTIAQDLERLPGQG